VLEKEGGQPLRAGRIVEIKAVLLQHPH
jgi:hypothetical protein